MKQLLLCPLIAVAISLSAATPTPSFSPAPPAHIQTDAEIQTAAVKGILANPKVSAADLRVHVTGGVVVLEGSVQSIEAKKMAEKIARSVPGVLRVKNRLRVR